LIMVIDTTPFLRNFAANGVRLSWVPAP
jgi:hypothetical protein